MSRRASSRDTARDNVGRPATTTRSMLAVRSAAGPCPAPISNLYRRIAFTPVRALPDGSANSGQPARSARATAAAPTTGSASPTTTTVRSGLASNSIGGTGAGTWTRVHGASPGRSA